jgi:hypothetical protein
MATGQVSKKWIFRMLAALQLTMAFSAHATVLDENCVINILNRTIQVSPNGRWAMPNVPSTMGQVRARATCTKDGVTVSGQSDYFTVTQDDITQIGEISFEEPEPIPTALSIYPMDATTLNGAGAVLQLWVVAHYPPDTILDVSSASSGINYASTNPAIATVSPDGVVTAIASGSVLISARKDGVISVKQVIVNASGDTDGDGLPDDWEIANGLNANDPIDAFEDQDNDDLSALDEFTAGTDPFSADTDGDGIPDGEELKEGADGFITSPVLADTDGDGLNDGLEIMVGSSPIDINDANITDAIAELSIAPSVFALTYNTIDGESSTQLRVTGHLIDGNELDLTATSSGTSYSSNNISICSFGIVSGQVFAGMAGTCNVTATICGSLSPNMYGDPKPKNPSK